MSSAELSPRAARPPLAPAPRVDAEHLRILASYDPEALEGDSELAQIVHFAARLCETEASAVTVTGPEHERFLVKQGFDAREIPREMAFCPHAMAGKGTLVVPDVSVDPRFAKNPNVVGGPKIRFYAGQPLIGREGVAIGTLSVIDTVVRPAGLSELQREGLAVLADAVMLRLYAHRKALEMERETQAREEYLHSLADSIPAIAWSATPDGHFDYFNKQMVEFTGGGDDQSGGGFHPEDWKKASALWQECLKTGKTYEIEHRLRRHDGEYRWMISRALPVRDASGRIIRWFGTAVDIHDLYEASAARELLAKELSHRIKNIFAVISGLVSLSARRHPEAKKFAEDLDSTIRALGRAHEFVRPDDKARSSNLHGLLEKLFAPYGSGEGARVKVTGDDFAINARMATPLALVFHELATNSAKYGALATGEGTVSLKVADGGETVRLTWRERGGKKVKKPVREGFGTRLVDMSVNGQLGGSWKRRFEEDGLVVELKLPKATVAA
jgi:PAS domain S-box-containing protein